MQGIAARPPDSRVEPALGVVRRDPPRRTGVPSAGSVPSVPTVEGRAAADALEVVLVPELPALERDLHVV